MEPPGPPRAAETPLVPPADAEEALPLPVDESSGLTNLPEGSDDVPKETSAPSAEESAPPPEIAPKAATWQEKDAGEWFPDGFRAHLEMLRDYRYEDHFQREAVVLPGWKILAATRRGRLHAHQGRHREDALSFAGGPHFVVLCVSDGAGAYQYSRIGSEVTCRTVVASLEKALNENARDWEELDRPALTKRIAETMLAAVQAAVSALEDIARSTESSPKDFRCTLLTTVVYTSAQAQVALASQVGDGFFAGLNRDGQARRYGSSDSGTYSGQVTCFVPDPETLNHAARIHSIEVADLEALILCTDGIEDPFYPLEKNAGAIFQQLYRGDAGLLPGFEGAECSGSIVEDAAAQERLAQWLAFEKKGENDDRTILILYRDPVTRR